jgi:16S rRNA U516 pseudouridylate synthase RsuA-like enzyme
VQVRLLVAAAGVEVLALKRVRVGGYRMPRDLKLGTYL